MEKRRYRTVMASLVAVLVGALTAGPARAQDWSTLTQPAPPPEPPADPAHAARWQPGDPIPAGYHTEKPGAGRALTAAGGGLFLVAYVPSAVYGLLGGAVCTMYRQGDGGGCSSSPGLLLLPAVGPFLYARSDRATYANVHHSDSLLLIDGVAQTGGLVLALVGLVLDAQAEPSLVPDEARVASTRVRVRPAVGGGTAGVMIGGSF